MAEYIEREALLKNFDPEPYIWDDGNDAEIRENALWNTCKRFVEEEPAADVAPVVHGEWVDPEDDGGYTSWHCSLCSHQVGTIGGIPNWKYCPNCGARMDGGEDNG